MVGGVIMSKNFENSKSVGQRSGVHESARLKKIILCTFAGMVAFVILFYIFSTFVDIEKLLSSLNTNEFNPTNQTIIFFEPNYEENIFDDTQYMGLDRNIYIYDISTGVTESLEPEDYEEYSDSVKTMVDFVNSIIAGDAETYNDFFSNKSIENGSAQLKESFTMQKLYNIKITRLSEEDMSVNGNNYTKYEFILEYMIMQNNGTFRTDIDSDASKKQYITLSNQDGELRIDNIITP